MINKNIGKFLSVHLKMFMLVKLLTEKKFCIYIPLQYCNLKILITGEKIFFFMFVFNAQKRYPCTTAFIMIQERFYTDKNIFLRIYIFVYNSTRILRIYTYIYNSISYQSNFSDQSVTTIKIRLIFFHNQKKYTYKR